MPLPRRLLGAAYAHTGQHPSDLRANQGCLPRPCRSLSVPDTDCTQGMVFISWPGANGCSSQHCGRESRNDHGRPLLRSVYSHISSNISFPNYNVGCYAQGCGHRSRVTWTHPIHTQHWKASCLGSVLLGDFGFIGSMSNYSRGAHLIQPVLGHPWLGVRWIDEHMMIRS